jgi:hypothetical protein
MKTKTKLRHLALGLMLAVAPVANAAVTVTVDPGATWLGFMNVFETPANGGGFAFNGPWGTADLNATFSGPVLTLSPNTSISRDVPLSDAFWWNPDGSPNKNMAASMYVQDNSLAGQIVNFTGNVLTNSLVNPYTSIAFIKEFDAGFNLVSSVSGPLTAGVFAISLATTTGVNIQYGFETVGPNARNELGQAAALGSVQITAIPEPSGSALAGLAAGLLFLRRRRG